MSDPALIRQLTRLSKDEWRAVKAKVDAFHSLAPVSVARQETVQVKAGGDLLTGIIGELRRRQLINSTNAMVFVRITGEKAVAKIDEVWADVLGMMPPLNSVERTALAQLCARELARYLSTQRNPETGNLIPLGIKRMVQNVDKTVAILDATFPGYIVAGLTSFIFRRQNGRRR